MIHTIQVSPETDPAELKKLFRKRLMTGGAVIRLSEELLAEDLQAVFERFAPTAEPHNLSSMILGEIAKHPALTVELRGKLESMELPNLRRTFAEAVDG